MDFTVEKLEKSQIKFNFVADSAAFEKAVATVYAKTKHKYKVPGFRPGHAPRRVIEGMYGAGVFFSDAVNELIDDAIEQLRHNEEYSIVEFSGVDNVDIPDEGGVKFTLTAVVKPEVKLGAYKGLSVAKKAAKVTQKQIDDYIETARKKQARLVDIDGEAAMGNTVVMDFVGKVDGEAFEGGTAADHELVLGSHSFIPGFEEQLVGVKAGDKKDVNVTFPADYPAEELAGKEAVFDCTIKAVRIEELPEVNDEFATTVSEFDTLAEYKADVKAKLAKEEEDKAERAYEDDLIHAIVDNAEVEVPEAMNKNEVEDMLAEFEHRLYHDGLSLDDYCKYVGVTVDKIREDFAKTAAINVRTRLVLEEIVKAENITLEQDEIEAKIAEFAQQDGVSADEVKQNPEYIEYIINSALSHKLIDVIKSFNKPAAKKAKKETEAPAEEAKEEAKEEVKEEKLAKKAAKSTKKAKPSEAEGE